MHNPVMPDYVGNWELLLRCPAVSQLMAWLPWLHPGQDTALHLSGCNSCTYQLVGGVSESSRRPGCTAWVRYLLALTEPIPLSTHFCPLCWVGSAFTLLKKIKAVQRSLISASVPISFVLCFPQNTHFYQFLLILPEFLHANIKILIYVIYPPLVVYPISDYSLLFFICIYYPKWLYFYFYYFSVFFSQFLSYLPNPS